MMKTTKIFNVRSIAQMSMLSVIAFILMYFDFPLPFLAPPFYKFDFSEVAVMIAGFSMGPVAAIVVEGLKIILALLYKGSSTAYVGEIANFIIGCSYVIPASIIYKRNKTKKDALIGMVIGSIIMCITGLLMNYFILIPAYSHFFKLELATILKMGQQVVPLVKDKLTFVLLTTTPFNIVKTIIVSLTVMLIYKHISPLLKK